MTRYARTLPPEYFEARYAADPDPWRFETSDYERAKYDATLAALPHPHFASALEVGCSIGVLTRQIAERCDRLVALDVAEIALDRARERCHAQDHVVFIRGQVPGEWPDGPFDLILLSEVIYYLEASDVGRLARLVQTTLRPDGYVVLVHWTGDTHYPLTGDQAADLFISETACFMAPITAARTDAYRLDVLARR
ncbi:class I SAM-dependent DNA methyltransferase [Enterovirga rhinocerotis]|uniref:Nodulation protein S (NodS) n=1 Tax=Enterovirga rhinocerotis TaxID=1339210 RepID=A0A4R7BN03_9HYPH|nr:SAM-dependent methyltransferase [Enterovirga rhinocerotis]TDR85297.1 nodulation protein S (NodS) [Enterovirga rhinocerotis]